MSEASDRSVVRSGCGGRSDDVGEVVIAGAEIVMKWDWVVVDSRGIRSWTVML